MSAIKSNLKILVKKAGLHDTFQDVGRFGFRQFGVPQSGAMDSWAHRKANWLVGNNDNVPTIECTQLGGKYQFLGDGVVALTGANMNAKLNGQAVPMNETIIVQRDDILALGFATNGVRVNDFP